jgi:parvulin-like peptidyl-prolyl isomerase
MKRRHIKKSWIIARFAALILLCWNLAVSASEQQPPAGAEPTKEEQVVKSEGPEISLRLPLMSPLFAEVPIAVVNGETIVLGDLIDTLESAHEGKKVDEEKQASSIDVSEILNRLITVKLIVQEAREMGMDELPEVKKEIDSNRRLIRRELLIADISKDVKADEAEVEKLRKKIVREWKIKSVLFEKEEDAKKMEEEIKSGKIFEELVDKAMTDKIAKSMGEGGFVKSRDLLPDVAEVISKMEVGTVSPVIKVGSGKDSGFAIMKLEEIRYPEDPEATEKAREIVLSVQRAAAVYNFKKESYKKNVKTDSRLMKRLDFEAKKPGFEKMLKDKRTIATIKGEKPVTVEDLAKALEVKFFHGIDRAIQEKEVNKKKDEILDDLIQKKLFENEAAKRGIETTEKFRKKMKEYEESLLFGLFVQKVMVPDVKVSEEEMKVYYDDHAGDYTTPEMMKIKALIFGTQEQADYAIERLRKGADFNWMKSNAEGQVDNSTPGLLTFNGSTVVMKSMSEEVQTALLGARAEDYRLYKSADGNFYVLYVQDVIPSSLQPYEETRKEIAKKVFDAKLKAVINDWTGKLRNAGDVKVYLANPLPHGEKTGKL